MADPVAAAYADDIHRRCPTCEAEPGQWCRNRLTGRTAAIPCVARGKPDASP